MCYVATTFFPDVVCKVCTWSRSLAQCYLFVTLTITDAKSHFWALQIATGNIHRWPSQLTTGALIQNIWMDHFAESFVYTFRGCPNLRNLAIWCHMFESLADALDQTSLKHLLEKAISRKQEINLFFIADKNCGHSTDLISTAKNSFIFPKIKRLQFSQIWDYRLFHFSSFSLLTHLALPCCEMWCHTFDGINLLLKSAKNLRSLHSPDIPYGTLLGESSAIFSFHPHHGFHMDSMNYSRWIPLDSIARHIEIPWENIIKCVIKNSDNIKNRTLDSAKSHMQC